jgi:hypothetical protein
MYVPLHLCTYRQTLKKPDAEKNHQMLKKPDAEKIIHFTPFHRAEWNKS